MTQPLNSGPLVAESQVSEPVRRVLARDALLILATDADIAVGIVRDREALENSLFEVALEHHLAIGESDEGPAERAMAWRHAGVIVRFCALVGNPVRNLKYTAEQLHAKSLDALKDPADPEAEPRNPAGYAFNLYRAARDLRLHRDFDAAQHLSAIAKGALNGSGAEPHTLHLLFELAATHVSLGQAADVDDLLREWDHLWTTRAAGYSTRYRCDFIAALARWEQDGADSRVLNAFDAALDRVGEEPVPEEIGPESPRLDRGLEALSVVLAKAECLASGHPSEAESAEAIRLGARALDLADKVRARWGIVARSRTPLSIVFHRVYGDIALLAAGVPGQEAAELGLRVALSAKQTGFAARMRAGRHTLLNTTVVGIIEDIIRIERGRRSTFAGDAVQDQLLLDDLRQQLQQTVSRMLADTVLPLPRALAELTAVIGSRWALDYVELTGSLATTAHLFRTLIEPAGRITFEEFTPDPFYRDFFEAAREDPDWPWRLPRAFGLEAESRDFTKDNLKTAAAVGFDWRELATSVLPAALLDRVADGDPIELLVSAHSWLSLVPWAALQTDSRRTRLIQRAVITQTPVFTCLQHEQPPKVRGRALIRLVGENEHGVGVSREKVAWGLPPGSDGQLLSECAVPGEEAEPTLCSGGLTAALKDGNPGSFLHIASHGSGQGLDQTLEIPGERISFGQALGLKWPPSVLMASCHVGQVINTGEAEPLNMVMAVLTGGARCVVAGIATVGDLGTGLVASRIVTAIRKTPVSLAVALRDAQLAAIGSADELQWALLAAYTQ